ncbi:transcription termination/antitermination protein NusG [Phenylobacterium immobile]|uniref:transcription termination/antitermination protein NusG n=1 Tax=Phenylobacterium immobile TaxID=21 RepID=UPI000B8559A1|nr:transcription termination/antitermination NusG family protein [Phenylobacterium immobile]
MSAWYALRCATRQEGAAQARLVALGYETFLPVEVRWSRIRRTKTRASHPLFLGYLFVRCTPTALLAAQRIDGVHHLVGWRDADGERRPVVIPDQAIAEIQAEQPRHDHTQPDRSARRPAIGDKVYINRGLWSGRLAEVLESPVGQRAALVMEGPFGGRISLDLAALEPLQPASSPANFKSATKAE